MYCCEFGWNTILVKVGLEISIAKADVAESLETAGGGPKRTQEREISQVSPPIRPNIRRIIRMRSEIYGGFKTR